jgi:hypothetical protein
MIERVFSNKFSFLLLILILLSGCIYTVDTKCEVDYSSFSDRFSCFEKGSFSYPIKAAEVEAHLKAQVCAQKLNEMVSRGELDGDDAWMLFRWHYFNGKRKFGCATQESLNELRDVKGRIEKASTIRRENNTIWRN